MRRSTPSGRALYPSESERDAIVAGLLELRRKNFLQGVWLDEGRLRIRFEAIGIPTFITWKTAVEVLRLQGVPLNISFDGSTGRARKQAANLVMESLRR